jgi:hypothetical protein
MELDQDQLDLLSDLVEASRKLPTDRRQEFVGFEVSQLAGRVIVRHPGFDSDYTAHRQDLELLAQGDLIASSMTSRDTRWFYVTPKGFRLYAQMKREAGAPAERVESHARKHLNHERFRQRYPATYEKWALAEDLLWADDSRQQLSAIGHHCREALQGFTSVLVDRFSPVAVDPDPQKTINRLRAVLDAARASLGTTEADFLKALVEYWAALSSLVQRQEHAGQKEGQPVTWEDARRVVFQTMCVLYEVDRSLS